MAHTWTFFRAGGVDQVVIRTGADIAHLGELDQKLWVALACPTRGIEFDPRTLDLIDTNHDGRIRAPEVIAAAQWACARLKNPDDLVRGGDTLCLEALADDAEIGAPLAAEARNLLRLRGKADADALTLDDLSDRAKLLDAQPFNGDGILSLDTIDAEAPALMPWARAIADSQGTLADRSGQPGIDEARVQAFFSQLDAWRQWRAQAGDDARITPPGEATLPALAAWRAVRAKVDDHFARCRVADYDLRAVVALNATLDQFKDLATAPLSLDSPALAELPLAAVGPQRALPLSGGVNPAWAARLQALNTQVAAPLLGAPQAELTEAQWADISRRLAPAEAWLARRPDSPVAALDAARLIGLGQDDPRQALLDLVARDHDAKSSQALTADLEKLLRLQRDLLELLQNFVNFAAFYRRGERGQAGEGAIFQAGTLYLDARSCDLSVLVADPAKHAPLAGMAKAYLAYCECRREGQTQHIVSAFTAGDVDFLFVGRNGVFYDRQGRDWDATITKVIENPTSIAQAFWLPYKKFLRMVEEQVAKRAAASDSEQTTSLGQLAGQLARTGKAGTSTTTTTTTTTSATATSTPAATVKSRFDVGTVAALGVALGSLSAVLVGVFAKFVELGWWIPVALAGIVLAISGPSMLIAWLKLRQRSLGPILDATGWAVNGRMRVNVRLGESLSRSADVPLGAPRELRDPYAERRAPAYALAAAALLIGGLLVAWRFMLLNPFLPSELRVHDRPVVRQVIVAPQGVGTAVGATAGTGVQDVVPALPVAAPVAAASAR